MANSMSLNLLIFLATDIIILFAIRTTKSDVEFHNVMYNQSALVYNITCDPKSTFEEDCQSKPLEKIVAEIGKRTDIQINITISQLKLSADVSFTNLNSLDITGIPGITAIVCIAGNAGIILRDVDKLSFQNINLTSCGHVEFDRAQAIYYSSAMAIYHCRKVKLEKLVIERSTGVGLKIIAHQGSKINISSAAFKENQLQQKQNTNFPVWGGGGIFIRIEKLSNRLYAYLSTTVFQFRNCTFENNTANNSHYDHIYTDILGKVNEGFGRGGGMYALFNVGGLTNVNVSLIDCKLIANNAFLGGGLSVKIYSNNKRTSNIRIAITDSVFEQNGCNEYRTGFGGGAHLTLHTSLHAGSCISGSHYSLKNVVFKGNCAELGGGVYHFSNQQDVQDSNLMILENCMFQENKAHMGSAVMMPPDVTRRLSRGHSITFTFLNCQFFGNIVNFNSPVHGQITAGIGTVYISTYNIKFEGYNYFDNNSGSALYVTDSIIDFEKSNACFRNNTGLQGGAVALIGSSIMIFGRKSYEFVDNTAQYKGGAVYISLIDNLQFIGSKECFFQYNINSEGPDILASEWKANVQFVGNRAKDPTAGHSIYATSLHPCQLISRQNSSKHELLNSSDVFTERGFIFDNEGQIATDGAVLRSSKPPPLTVIPGEEINHQVEVTDDLGKYINASFWATITEVSNGTRLENTSYSTLVNDKVRVRGKPSQSLALDLNILSPRQTYINLTVELLECPPGFELEDSECVCNLDGYVGLFKCDDDFQSYLLLGYWAGYVDKSNLATCVCKFCEYNTTNTSNNHVILPRILTDLDKAVCGETRTGIACGRCRETFTVHFHSPGFLCKSMLFGCKLGWLFYILAELVPVTFVFIIVLVYNINFTSGNINGFILFSQLLSSIDLTASGIIEIPSTKIKYTTQAYQIIYGFFNLNFFNSESLSFCLWKGASALDMLAIKYVTILYTMILIVTVICIMNKCGGRWLGRYCRITTIKASVIHGISSFLMIGYAQCINVSLNLLLQVHMYTAQNREFKQPKRVLLNGEIVYFSKQHLPYAIPALLCLLTVGLLPPALLLTYPLLNKGISLLGLEDNRFVATTYGLLPINTLKPLLDSFQGCFKDNFRFLAGLYFLYRWTILIIRVTTEFSTYYIAISSVLLFILTLHTITQPYLKRVHNIIDTLLLSNLILINFLSLFSYHSSHGQQPINSIISSAAVQLVLICLPLAVLSAYLCVTLCRRAFSYGCGCHDQRSSGTIFVTKMNKWKELTLIRNHVDEQMGVNEEEFIHDRLKDESIDYRSACNYVKGAECSEEPITLYTK